MNSKFYKLLPLSIFMILSAAQLNAATIYVNAAAIGNNTGASWSNAYKDLQDALPSANYGDEVWVAQGTYYPTQGLNRYTYFEVKNGVKVYGGFSGVETTVEQRDWVLFPTTLSGDIGTDDENFDNSFTVVYIVNADSTTLLDGFVIRRGNANSNDPNDTFNGRGKSGGGMYITANNPAIQTKPTIKNCQFTENNAFADGGAVKVLNPINQVANPYFIDCDFEGNYAIQGGAINIENGNGGNTLVINRCNFTLNNAIVGAAIWYYNNVGNHALVLDNCFFFANYGNDIGAVYYASNTPFGTKMTVENCHFLSNSTDIGGGGGAMTCTDLFDIGKVVIKSSVFEDNFAGESGAITMNYVGMLEVEETKFINNANVKTAGCFDFYQTYNAVFKNCLFKGCSSLERSSTFYIAPYFNANSDFLFANCTFADNNGPEGLLYSEYIDNVSMRFENCILSGNELTANDKLINTSFAALEDCIFSYCLVDNISDCSGFSSGPVTCGDGMLYGVDPIFVDPTTDDYRLNACSPARNAGNNFIVDSLEMLIDIDSMTRIQDGLVDLGAYEIPTSISASITQVACNGGLATVSLNLENRCPPLQIYWTEDNGSTDSLYVDTTQVSLQLLAGNYMISVIENNGDTTNLPFSISPIDAIFIIDTVINASSPTAADGNVILNSVIGGVGNGYQFSWSNLATTQNLLSVPTGNYTLTITDGGGCTASFSFFVSFTNLSGESFLSKTKAYISPNPSSSGLDANILMEGTPLMGLMVEVWDAKGAIIESTKVTSNIYSLPKNLPTGLYFVVLEYGAEKLVLPWVVK